MDKQTKRQTKRVPALSVAQRIEALLVLLNARQRHAYREAAEWGEATGADCTAPQLGEALAWEHAAQLGEIKGRVEALRAALIGKEG